MKHLKKLAYLLPLVSLIACNEKPRTAVEGTWKLLSATTIKNKNEVSVEKFEGQEMIKIINNSHFSFIRHDLENGKGKNPVFSAGAGTYKIDGKKYSEHLTFCNYREVEGMTVNFDIEINKDTLTMTGLEEKKEIGLSQTIIEKYIRVK
ncbi:MAG: hypothetical protein K2Q03_07965 [Sphingobacteriaceae bacterium]|nr:hypothetical protein [Sphingobacteriaceae bacterium]